MSNFDEKKILVVDDKSAVADGAAEIIRRALNCRVFVAYDGAQALQLAAVHHPDLILLDVVLPVFDGFEVLEELKRQKIATRVIMFTAERVDMASAVRAIKAGACDYILKPVDFPDLIDRIKRSLLVDTTINLSLQQLAPPIFSQLVAVVERQRNKPIFFDPGDLEAPRAESQPVRSGISLRDRWSKHWFSGAIALVIATATVAWALIDTLYIKPRDYQIEELRRRLSESSSPHPR